jgi:hypothetical protein
MEKNTKRCTDNLEKGLLYIEEFIHENESLKLAKQITEYAFSLGNKLHRHSFAIKCYVTKIPDIRFCIDRGSDCLQEKTMTNFLCIKPPCEIHVIAVGKMYLRPQRTTKFHIISTTDVLSLGYPVIIEHIMESFCSRIKEFKLQSHLCI